MSAAVFTARDAYQRRHLLASLGWALERPGSVEYVAGDAREGEATSLYLWTFYAAGLRDGLRSGREAAFDEVYGSSARDVAGRTKARQARRPAKKRKRAKR
jgi:hypothetical protein